MQKNIFTWAKNFIFLDSVLEISFCLKLTLQTIKCACMKIIYKSAHDRG